MSWTGHSLLACSTGLNDIAELQRLEQQHPQIQTCMGWHPWMISPTLSLLDITQICIQIANHIEHTHTPIGEIGMDLHPKWRSTIDHQRHVLIYLLDLAAQLQRPVILHIVRAHHEILRILRSYPSVKIYLHGFRGNRELVQQYLKYDVFFGFSVLNSGLHYNQLANVIPPERVLLESDGLLSLSKFQHLCQHKYHSSLVSIHYANFSQFCQ